MAKTVSGSGTKGALRLVPKAEQDARPTRKPAAARKVAGAEAFDIEAKTLPAAIVDAAFRSGDYPYGKRMKRKRYERELEPLQIELQKLANWVRESGERIVILFEIGRAHV